ncbi:hypothetical protein EOL94_00610 [bacterium]|nr:hypothetical protein [bacterium]
MSENKNKEKKSNLNQYKDIEGISNKSLDFRLWVIRNKKKFVLALTVFLILLSAGFFMYSGYHYVYYLVEGKDQDREMLEQLTEYQLSSDTIKSQNTVEDLKIFPINILKTRESNDIVTAILNPNENYYASFEYCFKQNNEEIFCDSDFIFPLEKKYLLGLSEDINDNLSVDLILKSIAWKRVNLHIYPDWVDFYSKHLDMPVSDIEFRPSQKNLISNKMSLDSLEFKIKNNTAFSYWEAPLNIILLYKDRIVGANKYVVDKFFSGEEKNIRLVWPGNITQATEVLILPSLNIVDEDIYIKY